MENMGGWIDVVRLTRPDLVRNRGARLLERAGKRERFFTLCPGITNKSRISMSFEKTWNTFPRMLREVVGGGGNGRLASAAVSFLFASLSIPSGSIAAKSGAQHQMLGWLAHACSTTDRAISTHPWAGFTASDPSLGSHRFVLDSRSRRLRHNVPCVPGPWRSVLFVGKFTPGCPDDDCSDGTLRSCDTRPRPSEMACPRLHCRCIARPTIPLRPATSSIKTAETSAYTMDRPPRGRADSTADPLLSGRCLAYDAT